MDQQLIPEEADEAGLTAGDRQQVRFFFRYLNVISILLSVLGFLCAAVSEGILVKVMMICTGFLFLIIRILLWEFEKDHPDLLKRAVSEREKEQEIAGREYMLGTTEMKYKPDLRDDLSVPEEEKAPDPRENAIRQEERDRIRHERTVMLENVKTELSELYREMDRTGELDLECEAIDLAIARIVDLSTQVYRTGGTDFAQRASQILSELTEGRYTAISLDEKMQVRINTPDKLLHLSQVSYGTMEQIYFALRMAAGQMLGGEELPLILDEPFAMYDDERLESAMRWMRSSGRQVLLFTCQTREQEVVKRLRS